MSPRTREANEHIRNERAEKIMMTSMELFSMYGYHNVSISQIAKKAGISQGLLYHYYNSKEELLEKIVNKLFQQMDEFMNPDTPAISATEKLKGIIQSYFTILERQKSFWLLAFPIITQPSLSPVIRASFHQYFTLIVKELKSLFEKLDYKNPNIEAYKLGATLDGLALNYLFIFTEEYPVQEMEEALLKQYQLI